ncbi:MAG: hypothetical protein HP493_15190 [Nitrospira sp.]|nr:hypothetical protein [Nitrospira sp.]
MTFDANAFMHVFRKALGDDYTFRYDLARCLVENAVSVLPAEPPLP